MTTTSLSICLGKASRSLSRLRHPPLIISLACQHVVKLCQRFSFCLKAQSLIAILITVCDIGNIGSGPMNISEPPIRARWSACSLACIPACPGTQVKQTGLNSANLFSSSLHTLINFEVILGLCRALIADWLSEHIYIIDSGKSSVFRLRHTTTETVYSIQNTDHKSSTFRTIQTVK